MAKCRRQQLATLLWKCWLLRKRHVVSTVLEFVLPLITICVLVGLVAQSGEDLSRSRKNRPVTPYHDPKVYKDPTFNLSSGLEAAIGGTIMMAPNNEFTEKIATEMIKIFLTKSEFSLLDVKLYENEDELVSTWLKRTELKLPFIRGAVVLTSNFSQSEQQVPLEFSYKIRISDNNEVAETRLRFPLKSIPGPARDSSYLLTFIPLQVLVNEAYLNLLAAEWKVPRPQAEIFAYRAPYPRYLDRPVSGLPDFAPMAIVFGFIITCPLIVKRIIDERKSKSREILKMAGLSDSVYWTSIFINYFLMYALQAALATVLFTVKFNGLIGLVSLASPSVLYMVFLAYGISFILFSMVLSIPFKKPIIGMIVSLVVWLVTFVVPEVLLDPFIMLRLDIETTQLPRLLTCLLPNAGLTFAWRLVLQKEIYAYGATWYNMFEAVGVFGYFTLGAVLCVQALSWLLSCVMIWYFDKVFNQQRPISFPLHPLMRLVRKVEKSGIYSVSTRSANFAYFEQSGSSAKSCIQVKDLVKEFGSGSKRKIAVNSLSLDVPRGQITVLLGHNGAGKSTTMAMITGLLEPTSGSVTIDGVDISKDKDVARKSVSLCPQHDVLFAELTVQEHLTLYARIKGTDKLELEQEVADIAKQIGLDGFGDRAAGDLSGGMKRKLSLGLALVGGTKVLVLDEPTSGMDVDARRALWDLLLTIRKGRTILLTTHYMEEADAVGDQVAIMASGELKCFGSSIFLKRLFGSGYQLRVAKGELFNADLMRQIVLRHFPTARLLSNAETEVRYSLENVSPDGGHENSSFPTFFRDLEHPDVGVESCGLSMTTMEEVFLKVGSLDIDPEEEAAEADNMSIGTGISEFHHSNAGHSPSEDRMTRTSTISSNNFLMAAPGDAKHALGSLGRYVQMAKGLFIKRAHFCRRYWPSLAFQVVLPAFVFALLLYLDGYMKNKKNDDPHELVINLGAIYGPSIGFFQSDNSTPEALFGQEFYLPTAATQLANGTFLSRDTTPNDFLSAAAENISIQAYTNSYISGATIDVNETMRKNIYYNNEALHSAPGSVSLFYAAEQKYILGIYQNCSLAISNHPFPSEKQYLAVLFLAQALKLVWAIVVPLTIPFLAASYVLFPAHEANSGSKLLQTMTGVRPVDYWFITLAFDCVTHAACSGIIYGIFVGLDFQGIFVGHGPSRLALLSLLMMFGLATQPIAYLLSTRRAKPSTAFSILTILYLIGGVTSSVIMFVFQLVAGGAVSRGLVDTLKWVLKAFPIYAVASGVSKVYEAGSYANICEQIPQSTLDIFCAFDIDKSNPLFGCCVGKCEALDLCYRYHNPLTFGESGMFSELVFMMGNFVLFTLVLVVVEYSLLRKLFKRLRPSPPHTKGSEDMEYLEDDDVCYERSRIYELIGRNCQSEDAFVVHNLQKRFQQVRPVKRLTVGVHHGECFGLLGVNGAGKTTTFKMLTGDLEPSAGNAFGFGSDLETNLAKYQQNIGYCPQFDAHPTKLTGIEALMLFGRLRGIREDHLLGEVTSIVNMVDLKNHAHRLTETYSGGNRRKLSLAMALIGGPQLLLLDEPTCGVDPTARRKIWAALASVRAYYGSSVVLTSHSMEECECLCARVGIMVAGRLRCLGSIQHLRAKYGQGFTVSLKLRRDKADDPNHIVAVQKYIEDTVASAVLSDLHETLLTYHVTDRKLSWSYLFTQLERAKVMFDLEDYAVSDTTLEQIFVSFARERAVQSTRV